MTRALAVVALVALLACCMTEPEDPWAQLEGNWVSSAPVLARSADSGDPGPHNLRLSMDDAGGGTWSWGPRSSYLSGGVFTNNSLSITLAGQGPGRYSALVTATYRNDQLVGVLSGSTSQFESFDGVPVTLVRGN